MKCEVQFQYKHPTENRPENITQDAQLMHTDGAALPLPSAGDSVSYMFEGTPRDFKVVSRHFIYMTPDTCLVNIVVTDISHDEMDARFNDEG